MGGKNKMSENNILGSIRDRTIIPVKVVVKNWGSEKWLANGNLYCGKELYLERDFGCSMHCHHIKDETFYLISGKALIEFENESGGEQTSYLLLPQNTFLLKENGKLLDKPVDCGDSSLLVEPYRYHRFIGLKDSVILEISTHHEDRDSYRKSEKPSGRIDLIKVIQEYKNFGGIK